MSTLRTPDDWVRALAESQHGVVARRQLLAGGFSRDRVASWLASGRLVPVRRGVYALGHARLTQKGRWMAAVLACGRGALLSHRSAAALWGLRPSSGRPEVTVPRGGARARRADIRIAHSRFASRFAAEVDGIPVTTVAWTLADLAVLVPAHHLRRAVERADQLELFDLRAVRRALAADPGRPGSPAFRTLLADFHAHGMTMTRSDVEALMFQICLDHGLARPQVNHHDNGREVDFRWPEARLIAEVDGWSFHRTRRSFAVDRRRDRQALAAGWRVARFTAAELSSDPTGVATELRALLAGRMRERRLGGPLRAPDVRGDGAGH